MKTVTLFDNVPASMVVRLTEAVRQKYPWARCEPSPDRAKSFRIVIEKRDK